MYIKAIFLGDQAHSRTDNMSTSGYEVIERINPYSDYQSLNEYDMMSDFHSNILHDSSNPDINHSISDSTSETKGASKLEHQSINKEPPSTNKKGSDSNTQINIPPTQSYLPHNAKPVYRKTPLPCRRFGLDYRGSELALLPSFQQDQKRDKNFEMFDGVERGMSSNFTTSDELIDMPHTGVSNSFDDQWTDRRTTTNENTDVPETGQESSSAATVCCYFEDAESVYEVYTI